MYCKRVLKFLDKTLLAVYKNPTSYIVGMVAMLFLIYLLPSKLYGVGIIVILFIITAMMIDMKRRNL